MLTEREQRIVDWLDAWANNIGAPEGAVINHIARKIERGDHLTWRPEPSIPASEWVKVPSVGYGGNDG